MDGEIKKLANEIIHSFTSNSREESEKWSLLNIYHNKYLWKKDFDKTLIITYPAVLTTLLDALQTTLFHEKWQEDLFDNIFLHGILHESFFKLVKRLEGSEQYVKQKVISLLQKFVQHPVLENLFLYQCMSSSNWNLMYVSKSHVWDDLITALISLPDRIANKTKGKHAKIFYPAYYVPLLLSTVFKALHSIYESVKNSQDCSLEFLAKLTGKICLLGKAVCRDRNEHFKRTYWDTLGCSILRDLNERKTSSGDIVSKMYLKEFLSKSKSDYIWRRISQNFVSKIPSNSLDSFITNILLQIPWYGYVEWILSDEGVKNKKLNYIMTVKLLYFRSFKSASILQNTIGYFANSDQHTSDFIKILDSLLDSWTDERSLNHQSPEQQIHIASALMICAGWLKKLKLKLNSKDYINKVLKGTHIRLGKSEDTVRSIGMIIGGDLTQALDPNVPALEFDCPDTNLLHRLKDMLKISSEPNDNIISSEDLKFFEEVEQLNQSDENSEESKEPKVNVHEEVDSDDDLEPYDMSNDIPESKVKRPLYLRDCMKGLIEQDNVEWTETCLRYTEELIKANPYATEEVAEEMAKILLHLTDSSSISDFVGLRHKSLITLTTQCPLVVASYLTSQFTERDFTIRQRLDILEVLAASSALLAYSSPSETHSAVSSNENFARKEPEWQLIVNQRLEAKTKHYTKAQDITFRENKFSAIAGNFFYPLLNSYEKACQILKLHGDDSYVLGRFINTLGIIMYSASNTLHCNQMGTSLLQFLYSIRMHEDVFVRKSIIFAVAATYTAVPSSMLFTEMLSDVTNVTEWLQSVAGNDLDHNCVEKALYTLSIFQNAAAEGSLLYQLKSLKASE